MSIYTLFERDASCPDTSYSTCTNSGLPAGFCCPAGETCIALAANTTVLCCPAGSNCTEIQPISCDLSLQNITAHADNLLKTTALTATLSTCGTACCPFGYSCNSAGHCSMDSDQSVAPKTSSTSSSSTSIPTSTSGATSTSSSATSTSTSSSSSATTTNSILPIVDTCNKFPATAILVGFFPGLVLGIILTISSICLLGAHRRRVARRRSMSSFGNISEPQLSSSVRTDFLRKQPQSPSTTQDSMMGRHRHPTILRVKSMFRKSHTPSHQSPRSQQNPYTPPPPPIPLNVQRSLGQERGQIQPPAQPSMQAPAQPPAPQVTVHGPVTPPMQREPSYENIDIFADRDTASSLRGVELAASNPPANLAIDRTTCFADMMEQTGLGGVSKGQREYLAIKCKQSRD
jgi:hypothetical protein